jgi:glycosyltransferase involved in cell wall biosynthesis
MRFGVVTTSYPRSPGEPAGNFVLELNEWLMRQGHEVEVLAAGIGDEDDSWQSARVERVLAPGGLFYTGGAPERMRQSRLAFVQSASFSAKLVYALRAKAARADWDAVLAHWLAPSALAAVMACPRLPIVGIAHSGDVHLLERLRGIRAAARLFDQPRVHLHFVSEDLRRRFLAHAGASAPSIAFRSSVCPMGIDGRRFAGDAQGIDIGPPTVVFLGRLVPIKGVDVLLQALSALRHRPRIQIAGSGPERQRLQAQASALGLVVEWMGELRGEARDALLRQATVVVIPSRPLDGRSEGTPVVALEALAAGARLIVSGTGGLLDIPEEMCRRVAPGDPAALVQAITAELEAGGRAPARSRQWALLHDWDVIGPKILSGIKEFQGLGQTT